MEVHNMCLQVSRNCDLIGKFGYIPTRSRHCNGEFCSSNHWEFGKVSINVEPEPGDLPENKY